MNAYLSMKKKVIPFILFFALVSVAHASILEMKNPDCTTLKDGVYEDTIGKFKMHTECISGAGKTDYSVYNAPVSEKLFRTQLDIYTLKGESCKENEGVTTKKLPKHTFTKKCVSTSDPAVYSVDGVPSDSYLAFMETLEKSGPSLDDLALFLPKSDFVDSGTFDKNILASATPPPAPPAQSASRSCRINPTNFGILARGAVGSKVTQVQLRLRTLGYFKGSANGHFGPITEKAVIAYQKAKGIKTTGQVASRTLAALNASCPK